MSNYRDAGNGQYVSAAYAEENPDTTVKESSDSREIADAARRFIDEFYKADEEGDRIPWPTELATLVGWVEPE